MFSIFCNWDCDMFLYGFGVHVDSSSRVVLVVAKGGLMFRYDEDDIAMI